MDIKIDISNTTLITNRLILRPWRESDLGDFYEYASVPGVGEMAGWKHHESKEVSASILKSFIDEKEVFAVTEKTTGKVIGSLGLHYSWANDDERYASLCQREIGYVLSKAYWGQGLIPEAVREVIRFCFEDCGLEAVTCGHFRSNPQSKRVIKKCGFEFVKESTFYAKQLDITVDDMEIEHTNFWICECKTENKGKFCLQCGKSKPLILPQYRCDKCGWEPNDRTKPPKFCPECGDPFDDGDIILE